MAEYIEREAAIKRFNFAVLDCLGMEPTIRAGDIIKALESIPAADVRPVVRGKWISHDKGWWRLRNGNIATDWHSFLLSAETFKEVCDIDSTFSKAETEWKPDYECSVCGSRSWEDEYDFCPNCGAKMEES